MLTVEDFRKRAETLYSNDVQRWKNRLLKGLPQSVTIRACDVLPYTRDQHKAWLWKQIQLQAIPCPYCGAPIDIISMVVDHKDSLRRGGSPGLENQQVICARCNTIKGELNDHEYRILLVFFEGPAVYFRQRLEGVLINGGVGKMLRHFPKQKKGAKQSSAPKQDALEFSEMPSASRRHATQPKGAHYGSQNQDQDFF